METFYYTTKTLALELRKGGAMFLLSVPIPENGRAHVDPCQPLLQCISLLEENMEHVVPVSKADVEEGW